MQPAVQPGYGPMPGQPGYGPMPGQPGYGPMPGQPGYGPMPGQPGYGPMPGQPAGAPFGQPGAMGALAHGALAHGGLLGGSLLKVLDPNATPAQVRTHGAVTAGIGVLLLLANVVTIVSMGRYYPYLVALVPLTLFTGGYLVVLGRPTDPATGQPAGWWKVGLGATALGSLAIGILAAVVLGL
ncbi:MAG: hypothetical protein HY744_30435 [Deltaproteobacteria bacterium]|nr:hypothetical protein [Deltaproteobacteria bacterium]